MINRAWLERDFYSVLGLRSTTASELDIKRAYRTLARKYHPDLNPGDPHSERRFKEIAEAYGVLSDRNDRVRYDHLRRTTPRGPARFQTGFSRHTGFNPRHYGPTYTPPRPGNDLHTKVILSPRDARRGMLVNVEVAERGMPTRKVILFVPAGTSDGERICMKGRGGFGIAGGKPGDLHVTVKVLPAHFFGLFPREAPDLPRTREYGRTPLKLSKLPLAARTAMHLLLNPNDVELNECLRRYAEDGMTEYARAILRERRTAKR